MSASETYRFEDCDLPFGFRFPISYEKFLSHPTIDIHPWWLVAKQPRLARLFFELLNRELGSSKPLIPFAKIDDDNGDIACFDGSNTSGSPRVYFWAGDVTLRDVDWSCRYSLDSFEDWLKTALHQGDVLG